MTGDRVKFWLGIPGLVIACLAALFTAAVWLTGLVQTPTKLENHMIVERVFHDSAQKAAAEMHTHIQDQELFLEALIRGECIENPRDNLARQGLLARCRALGIVPERSGGRTR